MCRSWEDSGVMWLCMQAHVRQPEAAPKAGVTTLQRTISQEMLCMQERLPCSSFTGSAQPLKQLPDLVYELKV